MTSVYNNIPSEKQSSSADSTIKFFDDFYQVPVEINGTALTAMTGFFESKGFEKNSAESVAIIILTQAKRDNLNAFQILDTLGGLDTLELSALVGEILNYNRFKTSSLGITSPPRPADEIQRNILA
jgi:hypothetical protein